MKSVVTGGAGFIGSHLVDLLVERGHEVVVLARPGEDSSNLTPGRARLVEGDVRDRPAVDRACAGADLVFHLAARTDLAGTSLRDYDVNVAGTEAVLDAARKAGAARFVFFSSMLAVGLTGRNDPIDEGNTEESQSWYGRSKRVGEDLVRAAGIPFTIVRPTLVYGPRERATMMSFFRAVRRRQFLLIGPDVLQSFAYVGNVVLAAADAAVHPGATNGTFFISDASAYTLAEFARAAAAEMGVALWPVRLPRSIALAGGVALDAVARVIGRELPLSARRVRTMTTPYVYSIEAARRAFGYSAPWSLAAGVRETARWYRSQHLV